METQILEQQSEKILLLDARLITEIPNFNVRVAFGDMDWLIESIRQHGVKTPIRCFYEGGEYKLVEGHRRMLAVNSLLSEGIDMRVPVIVDEFKSEDARIVDMLILNDGKPLTMLEESEAVNRLISYGYEDEQVSDMIGKSKTHIANLKMIVNSPEKLKKFIQDGIITPSLAIEMIRQNDYDKTIEEIERIMKEKLEDMDEEQEEIEEPLVKPKDVKPKIENSLSVFRKFIKKVHEEELEVKMEAKPIFDLLYNFTFSKLNMDYFKELLLIEDQDKGNDEDLDSEYSNSMGEY